MAVFLTGASGFVGGRLAATLAARDFDFCKGADGRVALLRSDQPQLGSVVGGAGNDEYELRLLVRLPSGSSGAARANYLPQLAEACGGSSALEGLREVDIGGTGDRESDDGIKRGIALVPATGGLSDREALRAGLRGCGLVIHGAAMATDFGTWPQFYAANVQGTVNLLKECLGEVRRRRTEHGARAEPLCVVLVSTVDVYGYPDNAAKVTEEEDHVLSRWARETKPASCADLTMEAIRAGSARQDMPYATTKAAAEIALQLVLEQARREFGSVDALRAVALRPANVYGELQSQFVSEVGEMLTNRIMLFCAGGHSSGGFVHVDDVNHAVLSAGVAVLQNSPAVSPDAKADQMFVPFNLSDNPDGSWRDFATWLAEDAGLPRPFLSAPYWLLLVASWIVETLSHLLVACGTVSSSFRPPLTLSHSC